MIIYVDVLLTVNFLITYFLLISSAVLTGYTYSRKRILLSSCTGALFCLYIFVPFENIVIDFAVKAASLFMCALIAFGKTKIKRLLIQSGCFIILNILLMGIVVSVSAQSSMVYHNNMFFYININPVMLVTVSVGIYFTVILFSSVKEKFSPAKLYSIDIVFENFNIMRVWAFYDSGLKIKDIVSNRYVVLLSCKKPAESISPELRKDIDNFLNEKYKDVKTVFVPVFFKTITGAGMIPAIKAEKIIIEDVTINNVLIGFVKDEFDENVTAIFGTDIKRQL